MFPGDQLPAESAAKSAILIRISNLQFPFPISAFRISAFSFEF